MGWTKKTRQQSARAGRNTRHDRGGNGLKPVEAEIIRVFEKHEQEENDPDFLQDKQGEPDVAVKQPAQPSGHQKERVEQKGRMRQRREFQLKQKVPLRGLLRPGHVTQGIFRIRRDDPSVMKARRRGEIVPQVRGGSRQYHENDPAQPEGFQTGRSPPGRGFPICVAGLVGHFSHIRGTTACR